MAMGIIILRIDKNIQFPTRETPFSAGLDFFTPRQVILHPGESQI